jgi:hypothetical protein
LGGSGSLGGSGNLEITASAALVEDLALGRGHSHHRRSGQLETVDTLSPTHCKVAKFGFGASVDERLKGVLQAPGRVVTL